MTDTKIAIAVGLLVLVSIGGVFTFQGLSKDEPSAGSVREAVVRADSHHLSTAEDGKVTLVEFLDFECEACGAAYPLVEQLREKYEGRVTFVARYFPVPSHRNAENAAHAVEAAARQGEFEEMYQRMFETQREWGEARETKLDVFVGFAEDLGLDMDQFMRDFNDPRTIERITADKDAALQLGVQGTPTLFINEQLVQLESLDQLKADIEAALAA